MVQHYGKVDRRRKGPRNPKSLKSPKNRHLSSVRNAPVSKPELPIKWLARVVRDDICEPDYFALVDESTAHTARWTLFYRTQEVTCFDEVLFDEKDEYTFTAKLPTGSICQLIDADTDSPFNEQLMYGLYGKAVVPAELCVPSEYDVRIKGRSLEVTPKTVKVTINSDINADPEEKVDHIAPLYDALEFLQSTDDPTSDDSLYVARLACDSVQLSRMIDVSDGDETYEVPLWCIGDLCRWAEDYDEMDDDDFDDKEAEWMYRDFCRLTERLIRCIDDQIHRREEAWTEQLSG